MDNFHSDDTTCLNMKREFQSFITGSGQKRPKRSNLPYFNLNLLDTPVQEKEKKERLKEAEITAAKAKIFELECKIADLESSNKKAKMESEHDLLSVLEEKENEIRKLSEHKFKCQYLMEKEERALEQLNETRNELESCKKSNEQKMFTLQQDKLQLEEALHQVQEAMRIKVMEMKNDLWRQTTELEICKNKLKETKADLQLQHRRSIETTAKMRELEEYKLKLLDAELKSQELEQKFKEFEEGSILVKSMKSQLSKLPQMEKEIQTLKGQNTKYRETHDNVLLIEEQIKTLKSELQRADERYSELEGENVALKKKVEQWGLNDCDELNKMSPIEMKRQLAELQHAELKFLEKQAQPQSRIQTLEHQLQAKEEKICKDSSTLVQKTSRLQQQQELIKRLQRKLLLVAKERDAFKKILDSYESEIKVNLEAHTGSRLQQQDQSIQVYQKQVEQLEQDLQRTGEQLTQEKIRAQQLEQRLQELSSKSVPVDEKTERELRFYRVTIAELEAKLENAKEDKFILESRIEQRHLQGDYDPMKTKVFHFRMNPAALAQKQRAEELKQLKEENTKLKERLKILEESGSQVQDLTLMVDKKIQDNQGLSYDDLKAKLGSAELKNKRLMQVFKEKSQELRGICYELTGYRIDMCNTNQYRLTNRYAESPNDWLLFQQSSSGEVQMLETEYSSTIQGLMGIYLGKHDSIPGLLSAITLELLSHQTMKQ